MINPVTRAALALRERRRAPDMAQILSALPVPVVLLDAENRFRYVNQAAEQFLGIPPRAWRSCACAIWCRRTTRCSCWSQVRKSDASVSDHDLSWTARG